MTPRLNRFRLLALAVLLLALAVRLWDLRARSLWFDEATEYWVATAPYSHVIASARTGTGDPPLYALLLHTWMQAGSGEAWLRLLSVLASVAGVAGVMVLANLFSGGTAAVCAGLLLALLPADVRYAQEAGQYAFVPAAVAWNLVCLLRMMREGTWRWVLGWTATALLASYLYYATVFPIAAAFLCVIAEGVLRRDMRVRRATGTALLLYIIGILPILISYLPTQVARVVEAGSVSTPEMNTYSGFVGLLRLKWERACELLGFQFTGWPHTHVPPVVVIVPVVLLMIFAAPRARRLFVWFIVALASYAAANAAGLFPLGYRWGMILTPLIICVIAAGATAGGKRTRPATLAALLLLVAVSAYSLPNRTLRDRVYPDPTGAWPETEDVRMVANFWMAHRQPSQPTYVYYGAAPAFAYYTRSVAPRQGLPSTWQLACWHDTNPPAFCRDDNIYYGRWLRRFDSNEKIASVFNTLEARPDSLWFVFGHLVPGDDRDMVNGLKYQGYRVAAAVEGINASACFMVRERQHP
ncbi:MAG TPA: glycosyltransferase family 39 protein [Candidatus Krumholzibacteria bacterium]|nr:glycosyltransferase family 39 protein [Candidatus Krumholzibacteria bacterium]